MSVRSLDGGISAWNGLVAEGPPEAGIAQFAAADTPADMAAIAWHLEEATRLFYLSVAGRTTGKAADDFKRLASAEERHKKTLSDIHQSLTGSPVERVPSPFDRRVLEGGVDLPEALEWLESRPLDEALELALSLEVNAYDRYVKMLAVVRDQKARKIFAAIAEEEKGHVRKLAEMAGKGEGVKKGGGR